MKVYFNNAFLNKITIKDYPMIGFWIQNCHRSPADYNFRYKLGSQTIDEFDLTPIHYQMLQEYMVECKYVRTNTFITGNSIKLSFNSSDIIQNNTFENNKFRYYYLYCVDYFDYMDNKEILDNLDLDTVDTPYTRLLMLNNLAGYIKFDSTEDITIKQGINNILEFDLPVGVNLNCSIEPLSEKDQPQVDHYNSLDIGQKNLYNLLPDSTLIEYTSGIDYVKNTIHYIDPLLLNGNMTISKSGVIQL